MSLNLRMDIDPRELEQLLGAFQISKPAVKRAAARAVRKAAKWTAGQASKIVGAELRLQQRLIRKRLVLFRKSDGMEQKIWLGLNAIAARRLGQARQTARGVTVGRHSFDRAFIIDRFGGGIYRRKTVDRVPLTLVKVEIDEAGERAIRDVAARAEDRLLTLLRQELNFELSRLNK